jgi:hypothetical protein
MEENSALEELQFIRKIIAESRRTVIYNGFDYIFWGIIVIAGMLINYYFIKNQFYFNYMIIWAVLISVGWLLSFYNKKKTRLKHPATFSGRILGLLWGTSGIVMTIIGFIGPLSKCISPIAISPILAIVLGSIYFLTGKIIGAKWISYLSIGWWGGGILLMYVQDIRQFLLMAGMMFFFQTVPGIILYRKYKSEESLKS